MPHTRSMVGLLVLVSLLLAGCGASSSSTEDGGSQVRDFVTWYQYDQNNEDPASDERVGNEYLRTTIPQFNAAFAGKWNWVNVPKAFDRMATELITAVDAAGDVPDLMHIGSSDLPTYTRNGTLQDIRAWAETQTWYGELDPNALAVCTGPDGGLYCIPVAQLPQLVFVWQDRFPNGYPKTPAEFMEQAEALKAQGLYAITFFGSTDFDGEGTGRFIWTAVSSFGGAFDDGAGNMQLNTPENIAAVEFIREIIARGYVPEIAFAGQFQEENAFKDASAGSFPTGIFGYRYVNPLTAPDGDVYGKGNEEDMLDAIAAGDVYLAPFLAAEGERPGCGVSISAFAIPTGAQNPEAAQDYINWIMSEEQNPAWVMGPGGGFPVKASTQEHPIFQSAFYQQAAEVVEQSACRPWFGSMDRRAEAQKLIMTTIYRLVKENPNADIAAALAAAEAEYNANN